MKMLLLILQKNYFKNLVNLDPLKSMLGIIKFSKEIVESIDASY